MKRIWIYRETDEKIESLAEECGLTKCEVVLIAVTRMVEKRKVPKNQGAGPNTQG